MEIREIVELEQNELTVVVHFRLDFDSDEVIRVQEFSFKEIEKSGFDIFSDTESFSFDDDWEDEDDWDFDDEYQEIDEYELINFMNEYYLLGGVLPEPESY